MKTTLILFLLSLNYSGIANASLPESMSLSLAESKQTFLDYSKKTSEELSNHQYGDAEISLMSHIDFGEMFDEGNSEMDTLEYRLQTVKDLAWAFSAYQLELLPEVITESSSLFNHDAAVKSRNLSFVTLALQYKKSKIKDSALREALNQLPFKSPISASETE